MVNGCMVFCYVVTIVGRPKSPVMAKSLLRFLEFQPVERHVHGFGLPWGDGVFDDYKVCCVVGLHCFRCLQISHRDEHVAGGDGFAEIYIEGAKLGLGGG